MIRPSSQGGPRRPSAALPSKGLVQDSSREPSKTAQTPMSQTLGGSSSPSSPAANTRMRPSITNFGDLSNLNKRASTVAWDNEPVAQNTVGEKELPNITPSLSKPVSRFKRSNSSTKESRLAASTERAQAEVRALAMDKPEGGEAGGDRATNTAHELLMMRLKSRGARMEAEGLRSFLTNYRACKSLDKESESRLDRQLKNTEKKAEDLRLHSEALRLEVADAERTLERVNNQGDKKQEADKLKQSQQMVGLSTFEKQQMMVAEDKREEEMLHLKEEARNNYSKRHRKLQTELIELRDFKVLLAEYRRVRLAKLQENLARVEDGRKLRAIVREMIRQGGQRVLHHLETTGTPLEPWMCEVLVNCCHLEIRMEDAQRRLKPLQKEALQPLKNQVEHMVHMPKEKRFERLCTWTWDSLRDSCESAGSGMEANPWRKGPGTPACRNKSPDGRDEKEAPRHPQAKAIPESTSSQVCSCGNIFLTDASFCRKCGQKRPEDASRVGDSDAPFRPKFASETPEVQEAEMEVLALRKLLEDTRHNAAAAICNRIRQASKGSGVSNASAMEWGRQMLTLMVNEDFAKAATKELRKTQSVLTA